MSTEPLVARAVCGAEVINVYSNPGAPRPEYFATFTYANGSRRRFRADKVRTIANKAKRLNKWPTVKIEWL